MKKNKPSNNQTTLPYDIPRTIAVDNAKEHTTKRFDDVIKLLSTGKKNRKK
jgi:hypothetical protein